jgi:hypothetical protein
LNLLEAVVTARKQDAQPVRNSEMTAKSKCPRDLCSSSQEQAVLLLKRMIFRQANDSLVDPHI